MTRSTAREIAVQFSYSFSFNDCSASEFLEQMLNEENFALLAEDEPIYGEFPKGDTLIYLRSLVSGVCEHGYELDRDIERYSIGWDFARLPRVATAIMRVAIYEILYMPQVPNGAAISEAVKLAKKYEDERVVSFINGILGSFVRKECEEKESK